LADIPSQESRRAFARKPVQFPVTVISSERLKSEIINGKASDLSVAGMGVIIASNLSVDQAIWIEFRALAFNQPLQIRAVVRHASVGRYGVQFLSSSRDHLHHIQQLIGSA